MPVIGQIWNRADPLMFCGNNYCEYVFHEMSPRYWDSETTNSLTVATTRRIRSTAACRSWNVTEGGDGSQDNITLATKSGPKTIPIPVPGGSDQTTFITNTSLVCGDGCSILSAFEASETSSWYFDCNVTVGTATNAMIPEHEVGADLRMMASGGIALQGYAASSLANDMYLQYHSYPAEAIFGLPTNGHTGSMSIMLARFAIGVVAVTAQNNSPLVVKGYVPVRGSHLEVEHWGYASMILIALAAIQLVLEVSAVALTRHVVVPSGGPTAVARVLQSMTSQVSPTRSTQGEEIPQSSTAESHWIYRSKETSESGVYDLYMEKKSSKVP